MAAISHSSIARIVLAYLFDQKLDQVGKLFCEKSPYLNEEYTLVQKGYKPARTCVLNLANMFRDYCEIDSKLNNFMEKLPDQSAHTIYDMSMVEKIDSVITLARNKRECRKRKASSTPESIEKRARFTNSFIIIEDLENETNISSIKNNSEGCSAEEGGDEEENTTPITGLNEFSKTMLENESYSKAIADYINKELEEKVTPLKDAEPEASSSKDQLQFNFDEVISNILETAVKDPIFDDLVENISSKAIMTQSHSSTPQIHQSDNIEHVSDPLSRQTPIRSRLRTRATKPNYSLSTKKNNKKIEILSDVAYKGNLPESIQIVGNNNLETTTPSTSTSGQQVMPQLVVIQPDNTARCVDFNKIPFQEPNNPGMMQENTFLLNIPTYYLDTGIPLILNSMPPFLDNASPFKMDQNRVQIEPTSVPIITTTTAPIPQASVSEIIEDPKVNTPQNLIINQLKIKSASTPSRKASHIRTLSFQTPQKGNLECLRRPALAESIQSSPSIALNGEWDSVHGFEAIASAPVQNNSISNTPKVAKNPQSCVRVLSRSTSENGDALEGEKEQGESAEEKVEKKIDPAALDEWKRIRSISTNNLDQHLRQVEYGKALEAKKNAPKKKRKRKPVAVNVSADTDLDKSANNSSLTEDHAKMLEDALDSAKKPANGKIFVKLTPRKKPSPWKKSPKKHKPWGKRNSQENLLKKKNEKKAAESSVKDVAMTMKEEVEENVTDVAIPGTSKETNKSVTKNLTEAVVELVPLKIAEKAVAAVSPQHPLTPAQPPPSEERPPTTPPATVSISTLVEEEEPREKEESAIKHHPKVLAKKTSAEYLKKEFESRTEHQAFPISQSLNIDNSILETPFKTDFSNFPITPRFIMPAQVQDTPALKIKWEGKDQSSIVKSVGDIMTPSFPITPGATGTPPKSLNDSSPQSGAGGMSGRRTDYSSGSSYYKPDESEDLDKKLDALLHADRQKSKSESLNDSVDKKLTEDNITKCVQRNYNSASGSSSSCSSSSTSESESSSGSSCDTTPVKVEESQRQKEEAQSKNIRHIPLKEGNIFEERKRQMAELDAKRQRTIEKFKKQNQNNSLKKAKPQAMNRSKKMMSRREQILRRKIVPTSKAAPIPTIRHKVSTPRKVLYLDNMMPPTHKGMQKKQSKSPSNNIKEEKSEVESLDDENFPKLCISPDYPEIATATAENKNKVYAFNKSPEKNEEDVDENESDSETDYEADLSFISITETNTNQFKKIIYDESHAVKIVAAEKYADNIMNIVTEDGKITLQTCPTFDLFEMKPEVKKKHAPVKKVKVGVKKPVTALMNAPPQPAASASVAAHPKFRITYKNRGNASHSVQTPKKREMLTPKITEKITTPIDSANAEPAPTLIKKNILAVDNIDAILSHIHGS